MNREEVFGLLLIITIVAAFVYIFEDAYWNYLQSEESEIEISIQNYQKNNNISDITTIIFNESVSTIVVHDFNYAALEHDNSTNDKIEVINDPVNNDMVKSKFIYDFDPEDNVFQVTRRSLSDISNNTIFFYYKPSSNISLSIPKAYIFIDYIIELSYSEKLLESAVQTIVWIDDNDLGIVQNKSYSLLLDFLLDRYCSTVKNMRIIRYSKMNEIENFTISTFLTMPILENINLRHSIREKSVYNSCIRLLNTRKYDGRCMPHPERLVPILITGLAGTGTHALSNILLSKYYVSSQKYMFYNFVLGLHLSIEHELISFDGSAGWQYAVNDILINSPYPHNAKLDWDTSWISVWSPRFETVIHLTRCPMHQISLVSSHSKQTFDFIRSFSNYVLRDNLPYPISDFELEKNDSNAVSAFSSSDLSCDEYKSCNLLLSTWAW